MFPNGDKVSLLTAIVTIVVFFATIFETRAQGPFNNYYPEKPGSCAPPLPVEICYRSCYADVQCQGIGKCCATSCGGTVCASPVTMRKPTAGAAVEKPGSCPALSKARWVCTSTCSTDSDCSGLRKCCKNRCGAMVCQKAETQQMVPIEIPSDNNNPYENPIPPPPPNPYLIYMN